MKTLTQFVKTTVIGGFVVMLPIAIVVIVIVSILGTSIGNIFSTIVSSL